MPLYRNSSRSTFKILLKICFYIITLSLFCRLGHAADHLAPVIPLHGDSGRPNQCAKTCYTEVCGSEALRLIKLMDESVDPCTNFYEFTCGNFIKHASLDEGDNTIMDNAQTEISDCTNAEITADLEDTDLEAFKKTKIYYQNCLDESRIEQAGSRALLEILNKIGGWPVLLGNRWNERAYNWMEAVYKIIDQKFVEYYFPASIAVQPDNEDTSKNAIKISGVTLNIGPNFFLDGNDNFLNAYLNNMMSVAVALGARNDITTLREMQQVLDFEVKLYNLTTPQEKLVEIIDEHLSIAELSSKYPGIPWLEYINQVLKIVNIVVDESEKVYVNDPDFVSGAVELARTTPKRVIANYLAWRVSKSLINYMPKRFIDIENEYKSVVEGTSDEKPRSSMCLEEVEEVFPVSISSMFVRKYFDKSATKPIAEIFSNLKSALRKNLQQTEWMDSRTRSVALEKVDAMNVTVGFAQELLDDKKVDDYYKELQIIPGTYLQSALNISHFIKIQNYKKLRNYSTKNKWTTKQNAAVMNAYNIATENSVEIPAGLIKVFYKRGRPEYINYGVLGTIVGHEVMHGFDNNGRKYDKHGNQLSWWQPTAERKFREKARCFIEQFGNYTVPEINMKLNGELTQGENIADNGGFRAAYLAYDEWLKRNNVVESCLPSLNYTPQQMFWISAASVWCGKRLPESLKDSLTDEHSPNDARVILGYSNIKEFATDFNCPVGSRMNPEKKCIMW